MLKFHKRYTYRPNTPHIDNPPPVAETLSPPPDTNHYDLEMSNLKSIQSLTSSLKVLEYKMTILEPQFPINGENHSQARSKKATVKEIIRQSLLLSTNHGIPNFIRSEHLLVRLTWVVFILAAFSACAAFIFANIVAYLEYDVFTKTKIHYKQEINLPALTMCFAIDDSVPLERVLMYCKYLETKICGVEDFKVVEVFDAKRFRKRRCFKFNGGVGDEVIRSNMVGYASGINMGLVLPEMDFLVYFIGDNKVMPTLREITG